MSHAVPRSGSRRGVKGLTLGESFVKVGEAAIVERDLESWSAQTQLVCLIEYGALKARRGRVHAM